MSLQSQLTNRGTRMTEHFSQLYTRFESAIRITSPQQEPKEQKKLSPEEQETNKCSPLKYSDLSQDTLNSDVINTEGISLSAAGSPNDSSDHSTYGSPELTLGDLLETSKVHNATIGSIRVMELPPELNKSVGSDGKRREKPVCFSKIKMIDKCSTAKKLGEMEGARSRRQSPMHGKRAKRRLSEEFDEQAKDKNSKVVTTHKAVNSPVKEVPDNIHEVHGVYFESREDADKQCNAPSEEDTWYVTMDDPHIYENIEFKQKEINVDEATPATRSPKESTPQNTPPTKSPRTDSSEQTSTLKKLTAVKHRMEKIIQDLGCPEDTLSLSESMCSTLKKDRSHSVDDLMTSDMSVQLSDSMYDPINLSSQLWGHVSPPRQPPSPETIRKRLFSTSRNNSPMANADPADDGTILWATSFSESLLSSTKSQKCHGLMQSKSSAFRPYTKSSSSSKKKPKGSSSSSKKHKYSESVNPPNNVDYICKNDSARAEILKSVSKRLFETPNLDDMEPVALPDLSISDLKSSNFQMTKWFSTPKLMAPSNDGNDTKGEESLSGDGDKTLIANSPSPRSTVSSDSGHGSCLSASPLHSNGKDSSNKPNNEQMSAKIGKNGDNEPIYETIGDTDSCAALKGATCPEKEEEDEVSPADHTYARIEETISLKPPALPDRLCEYNLFERVENEAKMKLESPKKAVDNSLYSRVDKCQHCSTCPNCHPQQPAPTKNQRPVHPDDIVRKTDIVDMDAFHRYTVADVLESMERLADEIPEPQAQFTRSKSRQSLYGMISDQKTRREISQALALETKLKQNANKYCPTLSHPTNQPLKPIENLYSGIGHRSFQEDEVPGSYKTMPISKVNRLVCVERDELHKENQSLNSSRFSKDDTYRRSTRSRDRSIKKGNQSRSKSMVSENRSLLSSDDEHHSYCNVKEPQFFDRGSRRSLLRSHARRIKPNAQNKSSDNGHNKSQSMDKSVSGERGAFAQTLKKPVPQPQRQTQPLHQPNQKSQGLTIASQHPPQQVQQIIQSTQRVQRQVHQPAQPAWNPHSQAPTAQQPVHRVPVQANQPSARQGIQSRALHAPSQASKEKPNLDLKQAFGTQQTQEIINQMFIQGGKDPFSQRHQIPTEPSLPEDPLRRHSDIYHLRRPSALEENHLSAMIVAPPPKPNTSFSKVARRQPDKKKTQGRPASTVVDTTVVSGYADKGKDVEPLGLFRRTRSAMHLKWKGSTTSREIFC